MTDPEAPDALMTIIKVLAPLGSEDRHRTVDAAMVYLGERARAATAASKSGDATAGKDINDGDYPPAVITWMKQYGISAEELDKTFHFDGSGFDIHGSPGRSKREKTLNTYILTGVGTFLATNGRAFEDAIARGFCETIGCYDPANHAKHIKDKGPEFSGDKKKGYTLTNVGIKRGAELVKELAGAAK